MLMYVCNTCLLSIDQTANVMLVNKEEQHARRAVQVPQRVPKQPLAVFAATARSNQTVNDRKKDASGDKSHEPAVRRGNPQVIGADHARHRGAVAVDHVPHRRLRAGDHVVGGKAAHAAGGIAHQFDPDQRGHFHLRLAGHQRH